MDTQAIIELYLRAAGWTKRTGGSELWSHEHVEVFKTTEEAWSLQQDWDDLDADDESRKSEPDCED